MIPHRVLNNEILGVGLKQRVTACRKRLRVNRNLHRLHFSDEPVTFATETASFQTEHTTVRESFEGEMSAPEFREREAWLRLEQEVGIT